MVRGARIEPEQARGPQLDKGAGPPARKGHVPVARHQCLSLTLSSAVLAILERRRYTRTLQNPCYFLGTVALDCQRPNSKRGMKDLKNTWEEENRICMPAYQASTRYIRVHKLIRRDTLEIQGKPNLQQDERHMQVRWLYQASFVI